MSEFVVFLFLERFFNLCHLPLMPEDFIFEALNPFLQLLGALQRPTLTTSDRDWINNSGNRFSALTDVEFVLSVKAAILDFTEAEVSGVGGGWVHIAMILSVYGLRSVSSGLVERFQSTGVVEAPVSTLGEDNTRDVLDGVEAGSLAVLGLFNVIVCQAIVIAIAVV